MPNLNSIGDIIERLYTVYVIKPDNELEVYREWMPRLWEALLSEERKVD